MSSEVAILGQRIIAIMNCKLIAKNLLGFIYCYLIYQNILLTTAFAQAVEVFDAIFYSPNDGDVITNQFITVTGVVGPISEEELEEGGICISYELYDGSHYWADDCSMLNGSTEVVNSVLQKGYQIKPYGSSPPSFPPHPGTYRLTLMAKTVFTNAYIKEMTIDFEPCENECIKIEQNLGESDECK